MDPITAVMGAASVVSAVAGTLSSLKSLFSKKPRPSDPVVALRPFFDAISAQLGEVRSQNIQIISRLDKLPEIIRLVIRDEMRDANLEVQYSNLKSLYNLYFSELNDSDPDWTLTVEGAQLISAPLHYIFENEYRVSKLYELIQFTFFADVATKEGARSIWRKLLAEKIVQQQLPYSVLLSKYDGIISELRSALGSGFVASHSLSAYPTAPLSYTLVGNRTKIITVLTGYDRVPVYKVDCCKVTYENVPKYENREVPDEGFNAALAAHSENIQSLMNRERDAGVELREFANALEMLRWASDYFALPKNHAEPMFYVTEPSEKSIKLNMPVSIAFSPRASNCYGA